jgi:hypothetical protein
MGLVRALRCLKRRASQSEDEYNTAITTMRERAYGTDEDPVEYDIGDAPPWIKLVK